ncbi:hypothetical protein ACSBR1_030524 [Camellia fascicularis]
MAKTKTPAKPIKKNQPHNAPKSQKPPSWSVVRSLLTCKHLQTQPQQKEKQEKQQKQQKQERPTEESSKKCKKMKCSGSLCSNTKVMHRPEPPSSSSSEDNNKNRASMGGSNSIKNHTGSSSRSMKAPLSELNGASFSVSSNSSSSASTVVGSFRGIPFRRLSGCYECRMVVDPVLGFTRDPSLRASICSCPDCGEIFMKPESLELHQGVRHAVSELGPEDTSKNIVEIIFQSSWLRKQSFSSSSSPICKIDRILKVRNTPKTLSNFEQYRETIKSKSTKLPKKYPRCIADGNELLRFHSTTFVCSLGLNSSSNLCNSIPNCSVCSIIKNGFKLPNDAGKGILTTATSGKAHDSATAAEDEDGGGGDRRAMLVCRVIAGRVRKNGEGGGGGEVVEEYDSVAGAAGVYSNLDELYVFNPRAILPCFVVIYRGF